MRSKPLRNFMFYLHRYLGFFLGLVLVVIGLTGSLLVFQHELSDILLDRRC